MNLLLVDDAQLYLTNPEVHIFCIYRKVGLFLRVLRLLHFKFNFFRNLKPIWYDRWKEQLGLYDKIVLYDTLYDDSIFLFIRKHSKSRIALCYRNRVSAPRYHCYSDFSPNHIRDYVDCLFSYNISDSSAYNMLYYNQFSLIDVSNIESISRYERDVFFIGKEKGRMSSLVKIADYFDKQGVSFKFVVVPDERPQKNIDNRFDYHMLPYPMVLKEIQASRCVLDIVTSDNYGMTYRPLEALMLNKKLITNYKEIKNELFYNKSNVFILGIDDLNNIIEFITKESIIIDDKIKERYSLGGFLKYVFDSL